LPLALAFSIYNKQQNENFGREKTLHPNRIPSRLQERKIVNATFSGDETLVGKQFN